MHLIFSLFLIIIWFVCILCKHVCKTYTDWKVKGEVFQIWKRKLMHLSFIYIISKKRLKIQRCLTAGI